MYTGMFKQRAAVEAQTADNLGHGVNPVHALHSDAYGRNIAPGHGSTLADVVPHDIAEQGYYEDPAGSDSLDPYNDVDNMAYGYGVDDGTQDHPSLGEEPTLMRASSQHPAPPWPSWGPYSHGIPGGATIRDYDRGALVSKRTKQRPTEDVATGWENKRFIPDPENAVEASVAQVYRQTSDQQRDAVREGSQAAEGRANADRASIASRIVGMRLKLFSGGIRHYDMTPRHADEHIRPWWNRSAGTADPTLMQANEQRPRNPMQRAVPAEPDLGPETQTYSSSANYGYVEEDVIPYAY